jgi:hypothetical protein
MAMNPWLAGQLEIPQQPAQGMPLQQNPWQALLQAAQWRQQAQNGMMGAPGPGQGWPYAGQSPYQDQMPYQGQSQMPWLRQRVPQAPMSGMATDGAGGAPQGALLSAALGHGKIVAPPGPWRGITPGEDPMMVGGNMYDSMQRQGPSALGDPMMVGGNMYESMQRRAPATSLDRPMVGGNMYEYMR